MLPGSGFLCKYGRCDAHPHEAASVLPSAPESSAPAEVSGSMVAQSCWRRRVVAAIHVSAAARFCQHFGPNCNPGPEAALGAPNGPEERTRSVPDPIHGLIRLTEAEVKVLDHPLFQRLRQAK